MGGLCVLAVSWSWRQAAWHLGMALCAIIGGGFLWGLLHSSHLGQSVTVQWPNRLVSASFRGKVHRVAGINQERGYVSVDMDLEAYRYEGAWIDVPSVPVRVQVWAEDAELQEGDRIMAVGNLVTWKDFTVLSVRPGRPGEGIERLEWGGWWGGCLEAFRRQRVRLVSNIWMGMPASSKATLWSSSGTQAGLLEGLLFGRDTSLPRAERERFRMTGTMHVMAVSGFNVMVITTFLFLMLRMGRFSPESAAAVSLVAVWGFVGLAGAAPSVVRAAVMATAALTGIILDRKIHALNSIAAAFLVMTVWDPTQVFDVGFQLSFLATAGIVVGVSLIQMKWKNRLPWWVALGMVTASAQVAVAPLLWWSFQTVSWISLPVNVLIAHLIPLATILGTLMVVISSVSGTLAQIIGGTAWLASTLILQVVRWASMAPWASVGVPPVPWWLVLAVYLVGGTAMFLVWIRVKQADDASLEGI